MVHVIPLLVETGQQDDFDAVVVVDTTTAEQRRRLMRRDGLTETEAGQRLAAQASRQERLQAATYIIDSSGPVRETMRQVGELWKRLAT